MYLFKRRFPLMSRDWKIYLHSTMYLFKPFHPTQKPIRLYEIYIPPCIYLNLSSGTSWPRGNDIYIPPCIYLNLSGFLGNIKQVDLHSTMYLFKRWLHCRPLLCSWYIYIPPCIYLNLLPPYCSDILWSDLHSTMYLFKLVSRALPTLRSNSFTFHHVSI